MIGSSVRAQLTLWYAAALGATMVLLGTGLYLLVRAELLGRVETQTRRSVAQIDTVLRHDPSEIEEIEEYGSAGYYRIRRTSGPTDSLLYRSVAWRRDSLGGALEAGSGTGTWQWETPGERHYLLRRATLMAQNARHEVVVAEPIDAIGNTLERLLWLLAGGTPVALLVAGAGGYALAGRALRPVGEMAAAAREITADRLTERLPIENPDDEFGRLATAFNDTLDRLEDAFDRLKRFTADASHELRTPLTSIKSVGEVALRPGEDRPPAFYREVIGSMLEEADRLHRLVADLLTLTRTDAAARLDPEPVDLRALTDSVVDDLRVLAEERGQVIETEGEAETIEGDPDTLRLVLVNLLDNAIAYTPEGGRIAVCLRSRTEGEVAVEVKDTGPGIPLDKQDMIFERFSRVDDDRSRDGGGSGLGLAIAARAARLNDGYLEVDSTPGEGSTFRIVLPSGDYDTPEPTG